MIKRIIGLTGSLGSGCTTSAKYLRDKEGYEHISISNDVLKQLADKYKHPFSTREQKQDFGNYARAEKREEYLTALIEAVHNKGEKITIECFRNPIEIDALRDYYPHFYLIALYAPKELRKSRQKEEKFDLLDTRDTGEHEDKLGQQVRRCVNNADIVLDNSPSWKVVDDADDYFSKLMELESYDILIENEVGIEAFEGIKSLKFNWVFRKRGKHLKDIAFKRRADLKKLKGG